METDSQIARQASLLPIASVAERIDIPDSALQSYGGHIAKLDSSFVQGRQPRPDAKLILVTAITPTSAGEGKTTTTIGLGDGLNRLGKRAVICLREPSLGPCFGQKGGATGGGRAQVVPMDRINLHFTGDFHAITSAHNLLAAMLDNHIYWGNALDIDVRRIAWRRVLDMNDRALRTIVSSLGGVANGFPREDGFDITVASEVMAIFCLSESLADLEARLSRIVVAHDRAGNAVTAADLKAAPAMAVLLKEAFQPNLVQTLENNPALVHGGPFANIAHGCNSLVATRTALSLGEFVVTEAGFGADLGAEKFFDIKCRQSGLRPSAVVLVATIRALKMHGGLSKTALGTEDLAALEIGFANLERHVAGLSRFGLKPLIAVNQFQSDTEAEYQLLTLLCRERLGIVAYPCSHWAEGSKGIASLAQAVIEAVGDEQPAVRLLYADDLPIAEKIETIAREIYGAGTIQLSDRARGDCERLQAGGYGSLPVCMAKTQSSFSTDPKALGAPVGHTVQVQALRLSAGAGFIVVLCGDIRTMPGLPRSPAAERIYLDGDQIEGLF